MTLGDVVQREGSAQVLICFLKLLELAQAESSFPVDKGPVCSAQDRSAFESASTNLKDLAQVGRIAVIIGSVQRRYS